MLFHTSAFRLRTARVLEAMMIHDIQISQDPCYCLQSSFSFILDPHLTDKSVYPLSVLQNSRRRRTERHVVFKSYCAVAGFIV